MPKIGINLVLYLPQIIFGNIIEAIKKAKEDGLDFVQIHPYRFLDVEELLKSVLPIKYCEDSWNDGSIREFIKGKLNGNKYAPQVHDIILFPPALEANKKKDKIIKSTKAKSIGHSPNDFCNPNILLIELSPKLWMTSLEIIQACEKSGKKLVFDTYHVRREADLANDDTYKPEGTPNQNLLKMEGWQNVIDNLCDQIELVHLQALRNTDEFNEFISGKSTELEEMIRYLLTKGFRGDFVLEFTTSQKEILLDQAKFRKKLKKAKNKIIKIMA
jgi:hypothetical protein